MSICEVQFVRVRKKVINKVRVREKGALLHQMCVHVCACVCVVRERHLKTVNKKQVSKLHVPFRLDLRLGW